MIRLHVKNVILHKFYLKHFQRHMQLPKSISPNPLFTSTIEIRFSTSLNRMELLQKMSSVFSNNFPILEEGRIPQELKEQEEQFK